MDPRKRPEFVIADHLHDMVALFEEDGTCLYLNKAGFRMLRVDTSRDVGELLLSEIVVPAEQERLEEILSTVRDGGTWSGMLTVVGAGPGETTTRSTLCPIDGDSVPGSVAWIAKDTTTDREVIRTLRQRAFYDQLTGLPHRSLFLDRLDLLLRRVTDDPRPLAVLFVTPDRFKEKINRFPQGSGDVLLKSIAKRIPSALGEDQTIHRWGDEDFVVLCERVEDERAAYGVAEAIVDAFREPFSLGSDTIFLTASIGVATGLAGSLGTDELIRQADAAGQLAKHTGSGAIRLFDEELRARALRRAEIEDELRGAISRNELVLHFQPEVHLRTNQIVACEALLRWKHREWGLVSPGEFIPIAESSNLIIEIGDWVLRQALLHCAKWKKAYPDRSPVTVAVNISPRQFVEDDFEEKVATALAETGADAASVCLEITEGVLIDDAEETIARLNRLKTLGVHLAVDDFGTGYSSLAYLRRFPVDILKVDQSFVNGLGHDPEDSAIVQAVVYMGQALQMTTLAEGVETAHHVVELRELDCDIAQGYHFARPVPAADFEALLDAGDDWLESSTG